MTEDEYRQLLDKTKSVIDSIRESRTPQELVYDSILRCNSECQNLQHEVFDLTFTRIPELDRIQNSYLSTTAEIIAAGDAIDRARDRLRDCEQKMKPIRDAAWEESQSVPSEVDADTLPVVIAPQIVAPSLTSSEGNIVHKITNRNHILAAEICQAENSALDKTDPTSVYAELKKMAEAKPPIGQLIGYSSDGVQYRGKNYQANGVPDVFTLKSLRGRISRKAKRGKTR